MKRILSLTAVVMMLLTLPACKLYNIEGTQIVSEYALIATDASDLAILDQYPDLEYVDLRGSTCYDDILEYSASHPNIKVRFSIALGKQYFNHDETQIKLRGSEATLEDLLDGLSFFRSLKSVHIDQIAFTMAQLSELKAAYPNIDFTYTVKIGNEFYDSNVTELNLSAIAPTAIDEAIAAFELLPNLKTVDLTGNSKKSPLTFAQAGRIIQAHPNLSYNYPFELFGQKLSPATESVTYKKIKIGNSGLNQIREALLVMPRCTYICLDDCGVDNEAMGKFREEFPGLSIVWRIFVDRYNLLTDAEVIKMQYSVNQQEAQPLQYCTNVKYLDMTGCKIRDFSFLSGMHKLECAVLQQTYFSDTSVLKDAKNLTWLDFTNCTALREVTSLSGLTNLKYLNLSGTKVRDTSPLDNLPLERFKCVKSSIKEDEFEDFEDKHPNCLAADTGSATGKGWRYDDSAQKEPCAYYAEMMKIFGYEK